MDKRNTLLLDVKEVRVDGGHPDDERVAIFARLVSAPRDELTGVPDCDDFLGRAILVGLDDES